MKIKYNLLIVLLLLLITEGFSQKQEIKDYTQEIPGSDLVVEMVAISGGKFTMGSPETEDNRLQDEGPAHVVKIDSFWISKYEITWDLYNLFVNRAIDDVKNLNKASDVTIDVDAVSGATIPYVDMSLGMGTGEDLPVANVTQFAASKFCEWLSAITGHFYRLPTEAEWEYAARAGTATAFYFGNNIDKLEDYAWYYENSENSYHKVGQKKPNPWGLYDMYGNVAEWTLDQYLPEIYRSRKGVTENPFEKSTKKYPRSVKGGSYYDDAKFLRSAARLGSKKKWKMRDPQFPKSHWWNTDAPHIGFRIVRDPKIPAETEFELFWAPDVP